MNRELKRIERLTMIIDRALFRIDGNLCYDRTIQAITDLANCINDYDGDTEDWIYLNEYGSATPDSIIVGAYWFAVNYHGGQSSIEYAMLSALGYVFSPGMSCGPEDGSSEKYVHEMLEAKSKE